MPIKVNGYSNKVKLAKKQAKRDAAEARQVVYDDLTTPAKVRIIKSRRGESKRELARIGKQK